MEIRPMKCVVVDDEYIARKGIIRQLKTNNQVEIIGEANCIDDFICCNEDLKPDLVFLDIMLRNKNSMDSIAQLNYKPMLVFVTAYSHFALNGFDLKAVDYLLKPVSNDRLNQCIEKAYTQFKIQKLDYNYSHEHLFLKSNGKYFRTPPETILFVKSMENYVIIYLDSGKLICKITMDQMLKLLPAQSFIQVHRSYIININKIDSIDKLTIQIGKESIPISRNKRRETYKQLIGYSDNLD